MLRDTRVQTSRGSSLVSQARRTQIEQTRASVSRQNCSPSRNSRNLKGKGQSVQTVETNDENKSLWHQEKGMETGERPH